MPIAIAKSRVEPSFFKFAGARLMVIRFKGNSKLLFLIADLTLSLASFTATSAKPTISKTTIPLQISVSTSTT